MILSGYVTKFVKLYVVKVRCAKHEVVDSFIQFKYFKLWFYFEVYIDFEYYWFLYLNFA